MRMFLLMFTTVICGCAQDAGLRIEIADQTSAIVKYESGAYIKPADYIQAMNSHCFPLTPEVVSIEQSLTGQYRFENKVHFRCLQKR